MGISADVDGLREDVDLRGHGMEAGQGCFEFKVAYLFDSGAESADQLDFVQGLGFNGS